MMLVSGAKFEELVFCDLWFPDSGFRILDSSFRFPILDSGFQFPGFRVAPFKMSHAELNINFTLVSLKGI